MLQRFSCVVSGVSLSRATNSVTLGGQFYKIVVRLVKSKMGKK